MVAPITAFNKLVERKIPGDPTRYDYYFDRKGQRQAHPIDRPLPMKVLFGAAVSRGGDNTSAAAWQNALTIDNPTAIIAYDRLKGSIYEQASLGVSLFEARESLSMISSRALQLLAFGRKILSRDLIGAARVLRLATVPKGASKRKSAANNYLEYHFGWSPLVNDIYTAVDVLQNPFKGVYAKGTASNPFTWVRTTSAPYSIGRVRSNGSHFVRYGALVSISNPNLFLANQLGLINPAVVAVELIPFSFVADWFFNLNQFLSQGTDWVGLDVTHRWMTYGNKALTDFRWNNYGWTSEIYQVQLQRQTSWTLPSFGLRQMKMWGWRRAAAAVSLLAQQVLKM